MPLLFWLSFHCIVGTVYFLEAAGPQASSLLPLSFVVFHKLMEPENHAVTLEWLGYVIKLKFFLMAF